MGDWVRAVAEAELAPGRCTEVSIGGKPVALYNVEGTFYATSNTCIHRGGPLGQGALHGTTLVCPWHAWEYDCRSGANEMDDGLRLPKVPVTIQGDDILIDVP